jgi:membrane-associated phospholipid phosphatase
LHHALPAKILEIAYDSLVYQGLYFGVLFGVMGRRRELREMFWLVGVSGLFTCAGAALFPALGPFKAFGVKAEFLPVMEQLRGANLHFALSNLTGVVSFPSFHTTMAVLYMYGFRRTGAIGWMIAVLNVVMIAAIPFFGGHYLVDMFAGGAVALVSVAIVKAWPTIVSPPVFSREYAVIRLYDGMLEDIAARLSHQRDQAR